MMTHRLNSLLCILIYPLTVLETAFMAGVVAVHALVANVFYHSVWYPARWRSTRRYTERIIPDANEALQAMNELESLATKSGAKAFWLSGTLLGLARLGKPLPHDNDLDIGIFCDDPKAKHFVAEFARSSSVSQCKPQTISWKTRLQNPDFHMIENGILRYKAGIKVGSGGQEKSVKVDIFLHFDYQDRVAHASRNTVWCNSAFDIHKRTFGTNTFTIPKDMDRHLAENYGDYKTEVKEFENSIDCPNAGNIFSWPSLVYLLERKQLMIKLQRPDRVAQINRRILATLKKGLVPALNLQEETKKIVLDQPAV
jgi:phosphorylcholine metabolism protein LicD